MTSPAPHPLAPLDLLVERDRATSFAAVQMTAAEQARRAKKKLDALSSVMGVDLWAQAMEEG